MRTSDKSESPFYIRRMRDGERIRAFDCNDADLNEYIHERATEHQKAMLSVTYVMMARENPDKILGFCSLANDNISVLNFSRPNQFSRFRKKRGFHSPKNMKSYPAIKVCRIGIDSSAQNRGAGTLLLDFVKRNFTSRPKSGCRFITVDAYIDAIPFYVKNGFCLLNDDDKESEKTRLLYFDLKQLA